MILNTLLLFSAVWLAPSSLTTEHTILNTSTAPLAYLRREEQVNPFEPDMVQLPGGCFEMGSPVDHPGRQDNERQHQVCVDTFAIGRYEVTFEDYEQFVKTAGYAGELDDARAWFNPFVDNGWGRANRPMIYVTLADAQSYAEWLSRLTGERYRLPTEAEWEYAARAGSDTPFYFGTDIDDQSANYNATRTYLDGNSFSDDSPPGLFRKQTLPVGSFSHNKWGLFDTHGNVLEWTCSVYDHNYDGGERRCNAGSATEKVVVRGGSWYSLPPQVRSQARLNVDAKTRSHEIGFRLVRETPVERLPQSLLASTTSSQ